MSDFDEFNKEQLEKYIRDGEQEAQNLIKFVENDYQKFPYQFKTIYPVLIQVLDRQPSNPNFENSCKIAIINFLRSLGFSYKNASTLAEGLKKDVTKTVKDSIGELISQNIDQYQLKAELEAAGFGWTGEAESFEEFESDDDSIILRDPNGRGLVKKIKSAVSEKVNSVLTPVKNVVDKVVDKALKKAKEVAKDISDALTPKAVKDIVNKAKNVINTIKNTDVISALKGKWEELKSSLKEEEAKEEPEWQSYNTEEAEIIENELEILELKKDVFDKTVEYEAPKNWFDKLPDWPPQTYLSILKDQTVNVAKHIHEGLIDNEDIEAELESRKYPYRVEDPKSLKHMFSIKEDYISLGGKELHQKKIFKSEDLTGLQKGLQADEEPISPTPVEYASAVSDLIVTDKKGYKCSAPPFWKNDTLRDDLTDQQNFLVNMLDMDRLKDEYLNISKKIFDQESDNPALFADEQEVSKFETNKNIVLANYYQYKANNEKIGYLNNEIENDSRRYLSETMLIQQNITLDSYEWNWRTRYLREQLLAWYNNRADSETTKWENHHWVSGQIGYITKLLTNGDYVWFDNIVKSMESNLQRLDDIEAVLDIVDSIENIAMAISKYKTSIEENEEIIETTEHYDKEYDTVYSNQVFDTSMFEELIGKVAPIGISGGELSDVRAELQGLRRANLAILKTLREMKPAPDAYAIIWAHYAELKDAVINDIESFLNVLIMDERGDHETEGWHCSPVHLELHIHEQLDLLFEWIIDSVTRVIEAQDKLPQKGLERLDSMLNKVNEIRMYGPLCNLPEYFHWAIDNINQAEAIYDGIWSDVFDCWEREYITRNWRILTEHHMDIMSAWPYGVPLFPALCMDRHLDLLLAPVPVDYRDNEINWLARNCRRNFKNLTNWLSSLLYAIGLKWTAIATVVNDTSLNGNDVNIPKLEKINELHDKNLTLKEEVEKAIKDFDVPGEYLQKRKLDEVIGASELAPRYYSNEAMLNRGSEVGLAKNRAKAVDVTGIENDEIDLTELEPDTVVNTNTPTSFVGDVKQLMPWYYGNAEWETTHTPIEPPVIPVPDPEAYVRATAVREVVNRNEEAPTVEIPSSKPDKYDSTPKVDSNELDDTFKDIIKKGSSKVESQIDSIANETGIDSSKLKKPFELDNIVSDYCKQNGIPTNTSPSSLMTAAVSGYLQSNGVPAPIANAVAEKAVSKSGVGSKANEMVPSLSKREADSIENIISALPEKVRKFLENR